MLKEEVWRQSLLLSLGFSRLLPGDYCGALADI